MNRDNGLSHNGNHLSLSDCFLDSRYHVVSLNVTKLRSDNIDSRDYMERFGLWEMRVYQAGGTWEVFNDLERMDRLIAQH